jgi:hypothetical protein
VLAGVFSHVGGYESGEAFVDGISPANLIGAGVVAVGALAAFMIPRPRRMQEAEAEVEELVAELEAAYRLASRAPRRRGAGPSSGSRGVRAASAAATQASATNAARRPTSSAAAPVIGGPARKPR